MYTLLIGVNYEPLGQPFAFASVIRTRCCYKATYGKEWVFYMAAILKMQFIKWKWNCLVVNTEIEYNIEGSHYCMGNVCD